MYRILGSDGKEYGPISAEIVRQWVTQGRLGAQFQVRAEASTEWKPLSDFPELLAGLRTDSLAPPTDSPNSSGLAEARTSGLAVTSVVLGALGCLGLTAIAGLICGIVALGKINKSYGRQKGRGLAITGICLSTVMLLLALPALMLALMAPAFVPAFTKARSSAYSRAEEIRCVNNMKQIGLALRIYSSDHNDTLPPDILSLTNELGTPFILVCPSDRNRSRPGPSWIGFTTNQISYDFLAPGAAESNVTSQVVLRCPIHSSVCLGDGSVHQGNLRPAQR